MGFFASLATAGKATYRFLVPAQKYELVARLYGHRDSIHVVEASRRPNGTIVIASAGKDGIHLWEIPSMSVIATPEPRHPKRGSPTALAWGSNDQDSFEYLVSGTVNGYLCIIKRMSGSKEFVEVFSEQLSCRSELVNVKCDLICKEKDTIRIVNASGDGTIQAWTFDSLNRLLPIFSVRVDAIFPRSAVFGPPNHPTRAVSVFGVTATGTRVGVMVFLGETGQVTHTDRIGGAGDVATAAVDDCRGVFVVDNGESTFDLCSLENGNLIRSFTFRSREVECRLPLQVSFANDGRYVVGGSDHGVAYVYDRKTAQVFDVLHHALDDEAIVQTISALDHNGTNYVFTATSGRSRHPYISVWKHGANAKIVTKLPARKRRYNCCTTIWSVIRWFVRLALVAAFALLAMSIMNELSLNKHIYAYLTRLPKVMLTGWNVLYGWLRFSLQNFGMDQVDL